AAPAIYVLFSFCWGTRRLRARCAIWASILMTLWPYRSRSKSERDVEGRATALALGARHVGFPRRFRGLSRLHADIVKSALLTHNGRLAAGLSRAGCRGGLSGTDDRAPRGRERRAPLP